MKDREDFGLSGRQLVGEQGNVGFHAGDIALESEDFRLCRYRLGVEQCDVALHLGEITPDFSLISLQPAQAFAMTLHDIDNKIEFLIERTNIAGVWLAIFVSSGCGVVAINSFLIPAR
jgi:hypothetical protein